MPLLQALVDAATDATTSNDQQQISITFSDKTSKYAAVNSFDHFHPDIFARLVLFCLHEDVGSKVHEIYNSTNCSVLMVLYSLVSNPWKKSILITLQLWRNLRRPAKRASTLQRKYTSSYYCMYLSPSLLLHCFDDLRF